MKYLIQFYWFINNLIHNKRLIWEFVKRDFLMRYTGSYLGIVWAFVQPAVSVLIYWFVFEVGFKSMPIHNFPFILWLLAGMIPWFFLFDSISSSTGAILENSFLVKKVMFRVSILPVIKILSALLIHLFFVVFIMSIFALYGYYPTIYFVQLVYYIFASVILLLGLSWITSAVVIFLRDVGQLVSMLLQFVFWLTPIVWPLEMIPAEYHAILKINPFYYIINGYRDSLIYGKWFWEDGYMALHYWGITLFLFVVGAFWFKKLRPHFADVL